jgi:hypothetical protein
MTPVPSALDMNASDMALDRSSAGSFGSAIRVLTG